MRIPIFMLDGSTCQGVWPGMVERTSGRGFFPLPPSSRGRTSADWGRGSIGGGYVEKRDNSSN